MSRSGVRSGGRHVVVQIRTAPPEDRAEGADAGLRVSGPSRVGFVVGRSVGSAVIRNRVLRRLRSQLGRRIPDLAGGLDIVVRALPSAASAEFGDLARDTDRCLDRALVKLGQRAGTGPRRVP